MTSIRSADRACVLMSTYNGSSFVREQLESLAAQVGCGLELIVRDDGSRDDTLDKIRSFAAASPLPISVKAGANLGVTASFLSLLAEAPEGHAAYFFCDQDDIWAKDKVRRALDALAALPADAPAMYACRLRFVSGDRVAMGLSQVPRHVGLQNALVENVATGCTVALNPAARRVVCEHMPASAIMHDWWCYLVVSALGRVVFDPDPLIDYRQHGGNAVGVQQQGRLAVRLAKRLRRRPSTVTRSGQAAEFLRLYGDAMTQENRQLVEAFVAGKQSLKRRLGLLGARKLRRNSWSDQLLLSAQLAFNDY